MEQDDEGVDVLPPSSEAFYLSSPPASPTRDTLKKLGGVFDDDVSKETLPTLVLGISTTPEVRLTNILRT